MNITGKISPHFSIEEFSNPKSGEEIVGIISPRVFYFANEILEEIRAYYIVQGWTSNSYGLPVTSWYRTKDYNKKIGGDKNSLHLQGLAVDIYIKLTYQQVKQLESYLIKLFTRKGIKGELGLYGNRVHIGIDQTYSQKTVYFFDKRSKC